MPIHISHGFTYKRSVYELNDAKNKTWWRDRIEQMEQECFKINHQRGSMVYDVLHNPHTFNLVAPILGISDPTERTQIAGTDSGQLSDTGEDSIPEEDDQEDEQEEDGDGVMGTQEQEDDKDAGGEEKVNEGEKGEDGEEEEEEESVKTYEKKMLIGAERVVDSDDAESWELRSSPSMSSLCVEPPMSREPETQSYRSYNNFYLKFLKKPEEKAAVWRPKTKTVLAGVYKADPHMTLLEKSGIITNKITSDFCSWIRDLGGEDKTAITEEVLDELFSIGFDKPAARALTNRIREMPTLTTILAKARGFEEADYQYRIKQEIQADILAAKKRPQQVAFGTNLKYPWRHDPPSSDLHNNWMEFKAPKDLTDFTKVWEGQLHLKTTTGFCHYLHKNPHLRRPPYLVRMGMFDPSKYARAQQQQQQQQELTSRPSVASSAMPDFEDISVAESDVVDDEKSAGRQRVSSRAATRQLSFYVAPDG